MVREKIDFIDVENTAMRFSQQARLKFNFLFTEYFAEIEAAYLLLFTGA